MGPVAGHICTVKGLSLQNLQEKAAALGLVKQDSCGRQKSIAAEAAGGARQRHASAVNCRCKITTAQEQQ